MPKQNKTKIVFIMVGLPASGKTTWVENNRSRDSDVINPDNYKGELKDRNEIALKDLFELFKNLRKEIYYDTTGIGVKRIQSVVSEAKKHGYFCVLVFINTDIETCCERNNKRVINQIPEEKIDFMEKNIERCMNEYKLIFDKIIEVKENE